MIAFGPYESGKTFTMFGVPSHVLARELTARTTGMAQRCGRELFRLLADEGGDGSMPVDPPLELPSPVNARRGSSPVRLRPSTAPQSRNGVEPRGLRTTGSDRRLTASVPTSTTPTPTHSRPGSASRQRVDAPSPVPFHASATSGRRVPVSPITPMVPDWSSGGGGGGGASGGRGAVSPYVAELSTSVAQRLDRDRDAGRDEDGMPLPPGWFPCGTLGLTAKVHVSVVEVRGNAVYDVLRREPG